MSSTPSKAGQVMNVLKWTGVGLGFVIVVVLLMLYLIGWFHPKVGEHVSATRQARPVGEAELVTVTTVEVPRTESAVGSVRPVQKSVLASKIRANVVEVTVQAGQDVTKGEVLVRLDDEDLRAKLRQAEANAIAARAKHEQAKIEMKRIKDLYEKNAAAQIEYERTATALETAEAQLKQAEQAVAEAETILGYATVKSPMDGRIIDKHVESGDTVLPGQKLVTLYDTTRMQLVANVRESLTQRLAVGQKIGVRLEAMDKTCMGTISEIVPQAEVASRTFEVKVTGPCPPGVVPGMFGRLIIPLEKEQVLAVPKAAVRRIGQLTVVEVAQDGTLRRRSVQLGEQLDDKVEVLSGLQKGERVALQPSATPVGEGA